MRIPRSARIAAALWIAFAIVVWNVVFDQTIVSAGRRYITAASAAAGHGHFLSMDDWMRPALSRGVLIACAAALAILVAGAIGLRRAARDPGFFDRR